MCQDLQIVFFVHDDTRGRDKYSKWFNYPLRYILSRWIIATLLHQYLNNTLYCDTEVPLLQTLSL